MVEASLSVSALSTSAIASCAAGKVRAGPSRGSTSRQGRGLQPGASVKKRCGRDLVALAGALGEVKNQGLAAPQVAARRTRRDDDVERRRVALKLVEAQGLRRGNQFETQRSTSSGSDKGRAGRTVGWRSGRKWAKRCLKRRSRCSRWVCGLLSVSSSAGRGATSAPAATSAHVSWYAPAHSPARPTIHRPSPPRASAAPWRAGTGGPHRVRLGS